MNRKTFQNHIDQLEAEDLREELMNLFLKIKEVKNYYLMELGDDKQRKKIYDKAKKDITSKYTTKSYRRPRSESIFPFELIDVYLHNAEVALAFMMEYRYDSNPLRNSINSTYQKALNLIDLEMMKDEYSERCGTLANKMSFAPWVFEDSLELYKRVYM